MNQSYKPGNFTFVHLGYSFGTNVVFVCVFPVTQVKRNRLNQRQRMEQTQKMGHQEPLL